MTGSKPKQSKFPFFFILTILSRVDISVHGKILRKRESLGKRDGLRLAYRAQV